MDIKETKTPLIKNVLSLIRVMEETCVQIYELLNKNAFCFVNESDSWEEECQILFNDLSAGINGLLNCQKPLKGNLNHAYFEEMTDNIDTALCNAISLINEDQIQEAAALLKYQLRPFLQELWEEVYYWGTIYPDPEKMDNYYKNEFADHHVSLYLPQKSSTYKYKISIFIPIFNKLDYTKKCINSILKNTDLSKYACEFILLNDGSSDQSQKYLEGLNLGADKKVLYLKRNVKTMIFSLAMRVCEGEFLLFVNNDTVVTKGWLDNLLLCIESDPAIISATPCTPNTSNLQADLEGRYPFSSIEELGRYENSSNPSLWEERARIMPVIALYRTKLINQIGLADRLFYTMEFWDDDFSLRARRAGYKQLLCRDTYCYHFGSITGKDAQLKENTLEKGRNLFLRKNHADAWGSGFCYDYQDIEAIKSTVLSGLDTRSQNSEDSCNKQTAVLGIDCGFGDTLLQIKNVLRTIEKKTLVYSLCSERIYEEDSRAISDYHYFSEDISAGVDTLDDNHFYIIYISKPLEHYPEPNKLLALLRNKLKDGGLILFQMTNLYYKPFLESFLNFSFPDGRDSLKFLNLSFLQNYLRELFHQVDCAAQTEHVPGIEDFISVHMSEPMSSASAPLLTSRYLKFCCRK